MIDPGAGDQDLQGKEAPVAAVTHHQRRFVEIGRVTPDHLGDQPGEALAAVADHLARVTRAGEVARCRWRVVATDHGGDGLATRAGVADHLARVTLAGEFDLWRLRVVAIDHGGDGLVIRARAWRLAMARTRDIS